jgi:hypothetical protein
MAARPLIAGNRRVARAVGRLLAVLAGSVVIGSCSAQIDFSATPGVYMRLGPMDVGERVTIGAFGPPTSEPAAMRIVSIDVIAANGMTVVGVGAEETDDGGIAAVPGWPPTGHVLLASDEATYATEFAQPVSPVVGLELTADTGAVRGFRTVWLDRDGRQLEHTLDLVVLACPEDACDTIAAQNEALIALGLLRP